MTKEQSSLADYDEVVEQDLEVLHRAHAADPNAAYNYAAYHPKYDKTVAIPYNVFRISMEPHILFVHLLGQLTASSGNGYSHEATNFKTTDLPPESKEWKENNFNIKKWLVNKAGCTIQFRFLAWGIPDKKIIGDLILIVTNIQVG